MNLVTYLPQHGILSEMFIPPESELPEFWFPRFLPFNFPGIPTWGNAQDTKNVMKRFLLTAINLAYTTTFPPGGVLESVTIVTAGVGQTPGVYNIVGIGGGGSIAPRIRVTVNGDGTVHAGGVVILEAGEGLVNVPTFTMPLAAGGAPAATFAAVLAASGLGPWTGQPTMQIFHNHRKVQLQLLQKPYLATKMFGTGAAPGYLKTPYLFEANDQITVECSYTSTFPGYAGSSNTYPNYMYAYLTMIGGEPR
jgi:hypothetical protein